MHANCNYQETEEKRPLNARNRLEANVTLDFSEIEWVGVQTNFISYLFYL